MDDLSPAIMVAAEALLLLCRSGGGMCITESSLPPTAAVPDAGEFTALIVAEAVQSVEIHRCDTCGKTFSTGQALGGHMTSHRSTTPAASTSDGVNSPPSTLAASAEAKPICGLHKCFDCGKTFRSGQALGGHKRKHYHGPVDRNAGARRRRISTELSVVAASSSSAIQPTGGARPVGLNLDLNLPALPEKSSI